MMEEQENLIGFRTVGGKIETIKSPQRRFRTALDKRNVETQGREAIIVPCVLKPGLSILGKTELLENIDNPKARELLKSGVFVTTEEEGGAREETGEFALLMNYHPGRQRSGRGGILMIKEEDEWKPVTITVETDLGQRKYFLDIKGTGTPDRCLTDEFGSLHEGARIEFVALLAAEEQHPLFKKGLVPRAVYYGTDQRNFGQVVRAIPTTLRPSFCENPAFDKLRKLTAEQMALGLGLELGRYLGFKPPRLAGNLQTDNAYLVDTEDGQEIIATDFVEILPLHESLSPFEDLAIEVAIVVDSVFTIPDSFKYVNQGIIRGIKEVRPEVDLHEEEIIRLTSPEVVAFWLFRNYLAELIVQERIKSGTIIDFPYLLANGEEIEVQSYKRDPSSEAPRMIDGFLGEEEKIFQILDLAKEGKDQKVAGTIKWILKARRRLGEARKNFLITNKNVHQYEGLLPVPFYR